LPVCGCAFSRQRDCHSGHDASVFFKNKRSFMLV
jgi:hypothetical protein